MRLWLSRLLLTFALVGLTAASSGCARAPVTAEPAQGAQAEQQPGGSSVPVIAIVAIGAIVLLVLVASAADSEPFLDYSDICGTSDCS
jgi:hypothetical protein